MTEKELGNALLKLDAAQLSGASDARQLTWKILDHDRRRVQLLSGLTIATWILALVVILPATVGPGLFFRAREARIQAMEAERQAAKAAGRKSVVPNGQPERDLMASFQLSTLSSIAVLTLATLCTVLLLYASRRATLRQVNASLVEISEQLKQLRQSMAK